MAAAEPLQVRITPHRSHVLDTVTHLLTAFVILMKGITKLEHAQEYMGFILLYFTSAAAILLLVLFHHRLSQRIRHLNLVTYLIEAIVVASMAYLQFRQGSLQAWFFLAAAVMFLAACLLQVWARGKTEAVFSEQGVSLWINPLRHPSYDWDEIQLITLQQHELYIKPLRGKPIRAHVAADAPVPAIENLLQRLHPRPDLTHG